MHFTTFADTFDIADAFFSNSKFITLFFKPILVYLYLIIADLRKLIQVQNTPTQLREPLKQYLQKGYVVLSNIFDTNQIDISFQEWNYQTKSRSIDLSNSSTWDNIHGQHDWQQGWAKWLYTSGIQVCKFIF